MPVISLPYEYLERLCRTDRETIVSNIPMFGADIERIEEDSVDVEFFANRPDLYSPEGVARALRGFLGIETGLPSYSVGHSDISFSIDPALVSIRPYLGSAVIRNLTFDEDSLLSLMGLQEALHWAVGRGRGKVAIGVHDLATVTPPFSYIASPRSRSFVPLDFEQEMTMEEMLSDHPKGRSYAHLVEKFDLFPLIVDSNNEVLSFPPIINGERTRVTEETTDILLDTTGTDQKAVTTAVNIICTALAEIGGQVESVEVGGATMPSLEPSCRTVRVSECAELLGIELSSQEMADLLKKMRYGATPAEKDAVNVKVPCYRADILHDWDLFEDVAIAYGYGNITPEVPAGFAIGKEHPTRVRDSAFRSVMTGLGYLEIIPFTLSNEEVLYTRMRREISPRVLRLSHPITVDQTMVRTDLLPLLLESLQINRHRELPQRLFAVGDVVEGRETFQKAAGVTTHPDADFSEVYAAVEVVCREMGLERSVSETEDPAFLDGRRGALLKEGEEVGVFGEIHPAVICAFELEQPVAGFEIDLRAVRQPPGR